MKITIRWLVACSLTLSITGISAENHLRNTLAQCSHEWLTNHMEHILPCYLLKEEPESGWRISQSSSKTVNHDGQSTGISIIHVDLTSLRWQPGEKAPVVFPLWQHRLTIYHPDNLKFDKALLHHLPNISWERQGESLNIKTSRRPKEAWLWQSH